jgi:peptidoglycan/xylan/chitin deacetylase (PgdA/CDA1 family)
MRIALTVDDLPTHASLPPGVTRSDVARSIIAALQAHHAPPTCGFLNANGLAGGSDDAEVLRLWRAAGYPLGNHTFSHMDLDTNTVEAFEQDVVKDEPALREYMGEQGWHWLRFPYLHEGDTPEKRRAVRRFLEEHGYRIAEVTANFDDWAFNDPYARCRAKNDAAGVDWMKERYLRRADESLTRSRETAERVYGRDIAHVMLLHLGAFEMEMLPRLLELLEQRGVRLVTLEEAESDAAYAIDPDVPVAGTLLGQMMAAKGLAPTASPADDTLTRLAGLCR